MRLDEIKGQILEALAHPEAEAGLYLENLIAVHEDEERPAVDAGDLEVLDALKELIAEGKVETDESEDQVIFLLKR